MTEGSFIESVLAGSRYDAERDGSVRIAPYDVGELDEESAADAEVGYAVDIGLLGGAPVLCHCGRLCWIC